MNLLAIDTSSDACSVALQLSDDVFGQHVIKAREHTKILIPMIRSLLGDADIGLEELDAIVLGNGPGSFIGMRIAASVAQGLAFASGLGIVPVSSMAAVAAEVIDTHLASGVVVAQDARMNEAYLGIYRVDDEGLPVAVAEEAVQTIEKIEGLDEHPLSDFFAAGLAWHRYPEFLELNRAQIAQAVDVHYPNARYLLGLGARGCHSDEAINPENVVPAYIRTKVATPPRGK
jgi:tRNA threonylcarbamoyladenosine biosynthesis protein TsaB